MFLEKDIPIIGRSKFNETSRRMLSWASNKMFEFTKSKSFPGQSLIIDSKGVPFKKGHDTIKFRRPTKFKIEGGE
jgi:hypothetical protein